MEGTQFVSMPNFRENPVENEIFMAGNVVKTSIPPCRNLCFMDIPCLCTEPFSYKKFTLQKTDNILECKPRLNAH